MRYVVSGVGDAPCDVSVLQGTAHGCSGGEVGLEDVGVGLEADAGSWERDI